MGPFLLAAGSALWLGILTSISPCPLATNVAAMSFVAKRVGRPRDVLLSGLLYTAGRSLAYIALGVVLTGGLLTIPQVSQFLQRHMNRILGPVLILVGMFLLDLLRVRLPGTRIAERMQGRAERGGIWFAGVLGIVFALSFCPVSAALFFGALLALAIRHGSPIHLPLLYGIGTALPVVAFAILLALGAGYLGAMVQRLQQAEKWMRWGTGAIFVAVGVYYSLAYIFGVDVLAWTHPGR